VGRQWGTENNTRMRYTKDRYNLVTKRVTSPKRILSNERLEMIGDIFGLFVLVVIAIGLFILIG